MWPKWISIRIQLFKGTGSIKLTWASKWRFSRSFGYVRSMFQVPSSKFPNTSKIHPSRTSHLGGFSERIRLDDLAANENVCKCHTKKSDKGSGLSILLVAAVQMLVSRLGHGSSLNYPLERLARNVCFRRTGLRGCTSCSG
jgi:hypothetical protein